MTAPLEIATRIGGSLVEDAVWCDDGCTWIGAVADGAAERYRTLPSDLYDGVAGVGLFLAHLAAATGDRAAAATARGAMARALRRLPREAEEHDGLYAGPVGVALAAIRAGSALGDRALVDAGAALVREACARPPGAAAGLDLMSGRAGRVLGLAALIGPGGAVASAAVTAESEALVRAGGPALTGYAHGMSGAAAALLEAWAATGSEPARAAAEGLVRDEARHHDGGRGTWADLRGEAGGEGAYAVAWCHGAGGIALARLRAVELTGAPWARAEALAALRATDRHARAALAAEGFDLSPCHGLTGLVEVLREGRALLGADAPDGDGLAWELVAIAVERHLEGGLPWPCGVPSGETPALMTGLAGIGLFFLRLHDPAIPSVLLVRS